jgi:hypothetical protein
MRVSRACNVMAGGGPMKIDTDARSKAIVLMHQALEFLDQAGEGQAAIHLQHAISIAEREGRSSSQFEG